MFNLSLSLTLQSISKHSSLNVQAFIALAGFCCWRWWRRFAARLWLPLRYPLPPSSSLPCAGQRAHFWQRLCWYLKCLWCAFHILHFVFLLAILKTAKLDNASQSASQLASPLLPIDFYEPKVKFIELRPSRDLSLNAPLCACVCVPELCLVWPSICPVYCDSFKLAQISRASRKHICISCSSFCCSVNIFGLRLK